jgi:cholesterol oxidase
MLKTTRRKLILGSLASLVAAGVNISAAKAEKNNSTRPQSSKDPKLPSSLRVKAVVIGSGFGGAVAAYHLGRHKIDTLVLERGRRWDVKPGKPGPFATSKQTDGRALWLSETDLLVTDGPKDPLNRYPGLVERYNEDGIIVWASSGVGGGSLVYNTVLLQPSKENFAKVFPASVNYDEMNREYYPRVTEMLDAGPIPDDILSSPSYLGARVFLDYAARAGLPTQRINTATNWHTVRKELQGKLEASATAGEIWYGGNSGYKNSLDKNYLLKAQQSGHVQISPLSNVTEIREVGKGYQISVDRLDESGAVVSRHSISCDYLFMGAGSMGSTSLLVKAKHKGTLPKLSDDIGKYWGNNGDTFGSFRTGSPAGSQSGGPAHIVGLDYQDNPYGPQTVIAFPQANNTEDSLIFLGMALPEETGYWEYSDQLNRAILHWPSLNSSDAIQRLEKRMEYTLTRLANQVSPASARQAAVDSIKVSVGATAHPCGGAVMDRACDTYGRVKGYKGLYVVDGALVPRGTAAANPALTIGALAERCMDNIIKNDII